MAQKIFYVDPANGSNDNDGSAPDKAWADVTPALSADDSTADAPALIYVRRNTTQDISGDDIDWTANPNRIIIGWPNEGEPYYDVRPTAGSDAGWDDDDTTKPKMSFANAINARSTTPSVVGFYNVTVETSDDGTDYFFEYSIGNITIENCEINHQRNDDNDSFISFHRIDDTAGETTLTVKNSKLTQDGLLFGCKDDVNWPEVTFNFISENNEYIGTDGGYAIWYWRASKTPHNITMKFDNINTKRRVLHFDEDNYNYAEINLYVEKVSSTSSYEFIYFRSRYKLTAEFIDSYFKINSTSMIAAVHYSDVGYDYKTDVTFKNCEFNCYNDVLYVANNYSGDRNSAVGDIILEDCNINCGRAVVFYSSDVNIYTQKFIINNCSIVASELIYSAYQKGSLSNYTFINIKNSSFKDYLINQVRNIFVIARNSTFHYLGNNNDTSSKNIYSLFDCTIEGSNHVDIITMNGGSVSGNYPYALIDATNVNAGLSTQMNATIRNSKTSALPSYVDGKIELFSCVSNDDPMPYAKIAHNNTIKASNILRVNGSDGSLSLSSNGQIEGFSVERLSFTKPANKSKITIYLASQNSCPELYDYITSISYIADNNGYTYNSNISTIEESTEEWSGLYDGYKSYKVTFDMPVHDTDIDIQLVIQAFPKTVYGISSPIYIDLKPDWA